MKNFLNMSFFIMKSIISYYVGLGVRRKALREIGELLVLGAIKGNIVGFV